MLAANRMLAIYREKMEAVEKKKQADAQAARATALAQAMAVLAAQGYQLPAAAAAPAAAHDAGPGPATTASVAAAAKDRHATRQKPAAAQRRPKAEKADEGETTWTEDDEDVGPVEDDDAPVGGEAGTPAGQAAYAAELKRKIKADKTGARELYSEEDAEQQAFIRLMAQKNWGRSIATAKRFWSAAIRDGTLPPWKLHFLHAIVKIKKKRLGRTGEKTVGGNKKNRPAWRALGDALASHGFGDGAPAAASAPAPAPKRRAAATPRGGAHDGPAKSRTRQKDVAM